MPDPLLLTAAERDRDNNFCLALMAGQTFQYPDEMKKQPGGTALIATPGYLYQKQETVKIDCKKKNKYCLFFVGERGKQSLKDVIRGILKGLFSR